MRRKGRDESIVSLIRRAYASRFRTILVAFTVFVAAGSVMLILSFRDPNTPLAQLYLNIGESFLTGAIFSLVLPIFLVDADDSRSTLGDSAIFESIANRFLGQGRVWANEDGFNAEFNFKAYLEGANWDELIFLGLSCSRILATFGHVIESYYVSEPRTRWRRCVFILADPESSYVRAHVDSEFGRADTADDINQSIHRITQIIGSISSAKGCTVDDVPIKICLTKTQIRFGLIHFGHDRSVLTQYRYASRSYFNPRFEIIYYQPGIRQPSSLGSWIHDYVAQLQNLCSEEMMKNLDAAEDLD